MSWCLGSPRQRLQLEPVGPGKGVGEAGGTAAPLTLSQGREPGNGPAGQARVPGVCVRAHARLTGWLASLEAGWVRTLAFASRLSHV